MTRKTSYGLVQLLGIMLVQQTLAAGFNSAVFPVCDSSCQSRQEAALMALYDSNQVKRALTGSSGRRPQPSLMTAALNGHEMRTGCFMEQQHQLGFQYCLSLRMVWRTLL